MVREILLWDYTSLFLHLWVMLIWVPGRPWSIQELRERSWDDLHKLWWACVKERNRIATSSLERQRLKAGYGAYEAGERDHAVSSIGSSILLLEVMEMAGCCVLAEGSSSSASITTQIVFCMC